MDRSTARSLIYKMLSLCYLYPDEKVYRSIAKGQWIREMREALHLLGEKNFDDYLRTIERAISEPEEDKQPAMALEYTRLFINTFPYVIAPPCGSIYLERERVSSVKTTSEVLCFYHEAGFALQGGRDDLPDHIAHELQFMGTLAGEESQASGNEKIKLEEIQMNFLSRFLLPWISAFCEKVVDHSRYPFYHSLGKLTKEFISFEKNYLGVPEGLNFRRENESETIEG